MQRHEAPLGVDPAVYCTIQVETEIAFLSAWVRRDADQVLSNDADQVLSNDADISQAHHLLLVEAEIDNDGLIVELWVNVAADPGPHLRMIVSRKD
jgi:hypothetical protein